MKSAFFSILTFLVVGAINAHSQQLVSNGSFEIGSWSLDAVYTAISRGSHVGVGDSSITGWTVSLSENDPGGSQNRSGLEWIDLVPPAASIDGKRFLDLFHGSNDFYKVSQVISTTQGVTYTVAFATQAGGTLRFRAIGNSTLKVDDVVVPNDEQWRYSSLTFTADSSTTTLEFSAIAGGTVFTGSGPFLDDVQCATNIEGEAPTTQLDFYAGITISGTVGAAYIVETSPDMSPDSWTTLDTITLPASPFVYVDLQSKGVPRRFYRATALNPAGQAP